MTTKLRWFLFFALTLIIPLATSVSNTRSSSATSGEPWYSSVHADAAIPAQSSQAGIKTFAYHRSQPSAQGNRAIMKSFAYHRNQDYANTGLASATMKSMPYHRSVSTPVVTQMKSQPYHRSVVKP